MCGSATQPPRARWVRAWVRSQPSRISLTPRAAHEQREQVCRVAAAARCLATLLLPIHPASLADVADAAIAWAVAPRDMAGPEFMARLVQREGERRTTDTEGGQAE